MSLEMALIIQTSYTNFIRVHTSSMLFNAHLKYNKLTLIINYDNKLVTHFIILLYYE